MKDAVGGHGQRRRGTEHAEDLAEENRITSAVIGAAIEVHRHLGPGLLESAYERCLCRELYLRRISYVRQRPISLQYKGEAVPHAYRIDLLVEDLVVIEIKSVASLEPIHSAQVLSYLRLGDWRVGLLLNFNTPRLKDGIRRLARSA